ncbi:MAG: hypothetical protein QOE90_3373 [Thermoplasmata archaeon]|nr:hypothetical protein [Thermoplasmata archaeon]
MKIGELVKTYRLINDPEAPNWSIKFVGALVIVAGIVAVVAGSVWLSHGSSAPHANAAFASTQANGDGSHTDYVGYAAATFDPKLGYAAGTPDALLKAWKAQHPGATILAAEPMMAQGTLVGHQVTWR